MELADVEDAARVGLRRVRRIRADVGGERGSGGGSQRGVGGDARLEPLLEREFEENRGDVAAGWLRSRLSSNSMTLWNTSSRRSWISFAPMAAR